MKVLVTGATGFVGSALVHRLLSEGLAVRGSSRRIPPPGFEAVEWRRIAAIDACAEWQEIVQGCGAVIHLAALAHQTGRAGIGRWSEFHRINVQGTLALARACRAAGVRRLIFVSSIAAIGAASREPLTEASPEHPADDYGRSKLEAEMALRSELEGSSVEWCILRPPLIYGAGNPGNMARLLKLIRTGLPLPLGSIHNCRSFMFVDNLADALVTVARHGQPLRSTYLLSDGSDFSTPDLVRALARASGQRVRLIGVPSPALKFLGRVGDLAEQFLGVRSGLDSYSVERLTGSLVIDSARFRGTFCWHPPVSVPLALESTCRAQSA